MPRPSRPSRPLLAAAVALAAIGGLVGQLAVSAQESGPAPAVDAFEADQAEAAEAGLELGLVPEEISVETLPDLVPVELDDGRIGYARSREVFLEVYEPNAEFLGYGVYEADGQTLLGHVVGGRGFIPGDQPMETSRPAVIPAPLTSD